MKKYYNIVSILVGIVISCSQLFHWFSKPDFYLSIIKDIIEDAHIEYSIALLGCNIPLIIGLLFIFLGIFQDSYSNNGKQKIMIYTPWACRDFCEEEYASRAEELLYALFLVFYPYVFFGSHFHVPAIFSRLLILIIIIILCFDRKAIWFAIQCVIQLVSFTFSLYAKGIESFLMKFCFILFVINTTIAYMRYLHSQNAKTNEHK